MNHDNVVGLRFVFEDEQHVYIALDLCDGGTLMDVMRVKKRLSEAESRPYIRQTIEAVHYLHTVNVIHRDIKLGNLFLHRDQIKLGDFGLAARVEYEGERKK